MFWLPLSNWPAVLPGWLPDVFLSSACPSWMLLLIDQVQPHVFITQQWLLIRRPPRDDFKAVFPLLQDVFLPLVFYFVSLPWALPLSSFDLCSRVHARLLATNTSNRHSLVNMDSPFCRWYSCMLGKKCSLAPLKEELRKQGVSSQRDPEQREIYEYMRKHGNQWELQSRRSFDLSLFMQRHDASCRAC